VPSEKIFDVPYTVDNDRFMKASTLSQDECAAMRQRFGLTADRPVVLFASKFIPRKHPEDVIRAIALLRDEGVDASLLMVGTGEMEAALKALVVEYNLDGRVVFGGFVNQAELPRVYAASDVFVLPAESEPWGLIVNEVMCAGVPVVVAEEVGCVPDLVHDGRTGLLMPAGDVPALAAALRRLLAGDAERLEMGRRARDLMAGWSYERCRLGIVAAAHSVRVPDQMSPR